MCVNCVYCVSHRQPLHLSTSRPVPSLIASLSIKMQSAVTSLNPMFEQARAPQTTHTHTQYYTQYLFYSVVCVDLREKYGMLRENGRFRLLKCKSSLSNNLWCRSQRVTSDVSLPVCVCYWKEAR